MEDLRASVSRALDETTFGAEGTTEPSDFRQRYEGAMWADGVLQETRRAHTRISDSHSSAVADCLREVLAEYIDTESDCIGHAFPWAGPRLAGTRPWEDGAVSHSRMTPVREFGVALVKGAAIIGADRILELVERWKSGGPLTYRTCRVVGVTTRESLDLADGIKIIPLPLASDELSARLPSRGRISPLAYLGHTIVSVETIAEPALFRPDAAGLFAAVRAKLSSDHGFERICDMLSLEFDTYVDIGLGWNDYGDLAALSNADTIWGDPDRLGCPAAYRGKSVNGEVTRLDLDYDAVRTPAEEDLQRLYETLKGTNSRTRVALARWKRSIDRRNGLTDRFIDLRIGLESLFLSQNPDQQLSFRLALTGAWLLGKDVEERLDAYRILKKAYGAASKAVHRGEVSESDDNRDLLTRAQRLCRAGIYHILKEGRVVDWDELILGVE